ncbi:hypothetical protein AX769_12450 [Frondihabitans sp. PAMC 28766]|uniref:hypothetical protein n=1 Tax=Frondihabitans sp. PAMC 28766 TaxID=1795630 RepID=UPI00078B1D85|nr:hypothetical protein [Frondihabitans sp. PAMC 28766]AMM20801.1 hypothetical protein AX769_12450 [Frondihabitans sp. PAMC 28766]
MDSLNELSPMRPVHADDVVPESRWAASPSKAVFGLAVYIAVGAVVLLAEDVYRIPMATVILVGGLILLGLVVVSIPFGIRRRRRRG